MKYYLIHNHKKIYFSFDLEGFKAAQLYVQVNGLKKRKLYVERM